MDDEARFEREHRAVLAALRDERGSCPEAGILLDHAHGVLRDEERAAVERHLALCARCRDAVDAAGGEVPEVDEVTWRRAERGFDRRPAPWRAAPAARLPGRRLRLVATAAAVVLAVSAVVYFGTGRDFETGEPVARTRGVAVQVLEPEGSVSAVARFAWSGPPLVEVFRLEVRRGEEPVWEVEVGPPPYAPPAELRARLSPGVPHRWQVEALGPEGRVLARSGWAEFEIRP